MIPIKGFSQAYNFRTLNMMASLSLQKSKMIVFFQNKTFKLKHDSLQTTSEKT